ncbi:MAG: helix-turn-helix transcriptional regulator, partial [Nocardioidaceae bacterium]
MPGHDFWLFDDERLALLWFTTDDRLLGAQISTEPAVVRQHTRWLDLAEAHATPYRGYLAADPARAMPPGRRLITTTDGRAQFGRRRLRVLREEARLTGKDLAARLGWAQSKVSRLENGRQTATIEEVEAWAQAVHASAEHYDALVAELHGMRYEYAAWTHQLRSGTARRQRANLPLEADAALVRVFVPGHGSRTATDRRVRPARLRPAGQPARHPQRRRRGRQDPDATTAGALRPRQTLSLPAH